MQEEFNACDLGLSSRLQSKNKTISDQLWDLRMDTRISPETGNTSYRHGEPGRGDREFVWQIVCAYQTA